MRRLGEFVGVLALAVTVGWLAWRIAADAVGWVEPEFIQAAVVVPLIWLCCFFYQLAIGK